MYHAHESEITGLLPHTDEVPIPTCRDMSELVTDYLDGALPLRARLEARMHLFLCTACQQYFDQIRQTVRLLGDASRAAPAADTERRLLNQVGDGLAPKPGDPG